MKSLKILVELQAVILFSIDLFQMRTICTVKWKTDLQMKFLQSVKQFNHVNNTNSKQQSFRLGLGYCNTIQYNTIQLYDKEIYTYCTSLSISTINNTTDNIYWHKIHEQNMKEYKGNFRRIIRVNEMVFQYQENAFRGPKLSIS